MTSAALKHRQELQEAPAVLPGASMNAAVVARVPAITIHAFSETPALAAEFERAAADRRMSRAHLKTMVGGIKAASNHYRTVPTPNLIVLETRALGDAVLAELDMLATVCDIATRIIVIGESNDIELYRALMRRGVSEYLRAPVDAVALVATISGLFSEPGAAKLGRVYAFIGARGGVGSSTVAHNVASTLGRHSGSDVILADMDLAFGTAALDFDLDPEGGIADAIREPGRLDEQMLERLLTRCDEHLNLLAAPALLDAPGDVDAEAFEAVLDLAQASVSHLVLDIPHVWSAWAVRTLKAADEVVITATPDLASLRNARNLIAMLRQARPNDPDPRLVLNQVGMPKRPEIKPAEFAEVLQLTPLVLLPFRPQSFGAAANSGRMLVDVAKEAALVTPLRTIAETLSGRPLQKPSRLGGLAKLFRRRRATRRTA